MASRYLAHDFKRFLLGSVAATMTVAAAAPVSAQVAGTPATSPTEIEQQAASPAAQTSVADPQPASAGPVQEVDEGGELIVTGSRIVRDGYNAPTPTTVVGVEDIQKAAPANIADFVNQLPQLSGSSTTRTGNGNTSTGTNGLNTLNLRSLGSNRTLVLLDGRRVVASSPTAVVDINNLPSALVERVDIVTGGASAAYGSDAVAGVVNFVLNKKFEGVRGQIQGGITERGDNGNYTAALAAGKGFASDRGRVILSVEGAFQEGIDTLTASSRDWFTQTNLLTNSAAAVAAGGPRRIIRSNVNLVNVTEGGIITGSLIGTTASSLFTDTNFGAGGAIVPFVRGTNVAAPFMVGGSQWSEGGLVALDSRLKRWAGFGRVSYDLSDAISASIEGSYGYSRTENTAAYQRYAGNLTVSAANPFIDAGLRARAAAAGVTQFRYGWSSADLGRPRNIATRETYRVAAALNGKLGGTFRWDAYYQFGQTDTESLLRNTTNNARFTQSIDAVRNAAGQIVCRSTLTNPNNGCVPLNIFGIGVATPAAIAYVKGTASQNLRLRQNVGAASITGEPFSTWAGPVSIAAGGEYRKEEISGTGDPVSAVNGFYTGNYKGTNGSYDVKEVFGEVVVPLARDIPLLRTLELNGAARYTDYSTSGGVTTWKAGVTWQPFDGLRLRGVRSRDIRAANLSELFLAGQTQQQDVNDPQRALVLTRIERLQIGNLGLQPERADTTSLGAVFTPGWLRQFSLSVDYYDIKLKDAITSLANQDIVDRCSRGETILCQFVVRDPARDNIITRLIAQPINLAELRTNGVDIETSFRQPLGDVVSGWGGTVTVRALASHIANRTTINGGVRTEAAGQNTLDAPRWRWFGTLSYDNDKLTLLGTVRGISAGVYDTLWVSGRDIDDNRIAGATYFDLAGSVRILPGDRPQAELFFKVENLLDKDPPVVAGNGISSLQTNPILYDVVGRSFRVGFRFRY